MMMPTFSRGLRIGLAAVALMISCGGAAAHAVHAARPHASAKLTLVAYSTPRDAYAKIIPAFQKTAAGRGVTFSTSYGASGDQSRAVDAGLPADVVAFSLEPDITRLVKDGLVDTRWNQGPYKGMVTDDLVVLGVRSGNPKHIHGWADLINPGVDVITPNPFTSGGARWNVMAAYGAQLVLGKSPSQAQLYLKALFANVSVQDKSARDELQTFLGGKGDVMIGYESDIKTAQRKGAKIDYVVPDQTILIENPVAVVSHSSNRAAATAFVDFLWSPTAQTIYGQNGYRPVLPSVARQFKLESPKNLFTIKYVGGWSLVMKKFFDPTTGIMAQIEQGKGVGTH